MKITYGKGKTQYGTGVQIDLTGNEVAKAIYTYLIAHDVNIFGPATIRVNGELCESGGIYVDPSGRVIADGVEWNGKGPKNTPTQQRLIEWLVSGGYTLEDAEQQIKHAVISEHNGIHIIRYDNGMKDVVEITDNSIELI